MKNKNIKPFTFDEIYPWSDRGEEGGGPGGGQQGPSVTTTGKLVDPGTGGKPKATPTITTTKGGNGPGGLRGGGDGGGAGGSGKEDKPPVTPTLTQDGGGMPPENQSSENDPQNLDDHIPLGKEPEEVLPSGDKPNPRLNEEEREKKRINIDRDLKEKASNRRGRGMNDDPLFPLEKMEYSTVQTVDYKNVLKKLLTNLSIIYSDKIHQKSYSHGYAEYKTEKIRQNLTVVVAIDISMSIVDKAKLFLNEAYKIGMMFKKVKLMVILWSDGVESFGFCENKSQLQGFLNKMLNKIKGGGTEMSPVATIVTENVLNRRLSNMTPVIYLTDGVIEPNAILSNLVKANYIFVTKEEGTLDYVLPLRKKYSNLTVAWINI